MTNYKEKALAVARIVEDAKKGAPITMDTRTEVDLFKEKVLKNGSHTRGTHNGHFVERVYKDTHTVIRNVKYKNIAPVKMDFAIKDLTAKLVDDKESLERFIQKYGTNVDIEYLRISKEEIENLPYKSKIRYNAVAKNIRALIKMVKEFNAEGYDAAIRQKVNSREYLGDVVYRNKQVRNNEVQYDENGIIYTGYYLSAYPTRCRKHQKGIRERYTIVERDDNDMLVEKPISIRELCSIPQLLMSNERVVDPITGDRIPKKKSPRFAEDSAYMELVKQKIIVDHNCGQERCTFDINIKDIKSIRGVDVSQYDED